MTFQNVLDTFFLPEDQDAFARSQGWEDAAQMVYYENLAMQAEGKSDAAARIMGYESADSITEELNRMDREAASKQDGLLHELAKMDSREVYTDSEDCPHDGDFSEWAAAVYTNDLAGVY